jgi:hypothetical protein
LGKERKRDEMKYLHKWNLAVAKYKYKSEPENAGCERKERRNRMEAAGHPALEMLPAG